MQIQGWNFFVNAGQVISEQTVRDTANQAESWGSGGLFHSQLSEGIPGRLSKVFHPNIRSGPIEKKTVHKRFFGTGIPTRRNTVSFLDRTHLHAWTTHYRKLVETPSSLVFHRCLPRTVHLCAFPRSQKAPQSRIGSQVAPHRQIGSKEAPHWQIG